MRNIYIFVGLFVVIIATFKINDVNGREISDQFMELRSNDDSEQLDDEEQNEKRYVDQSIIVDYKAKRSAISATRFDCTRIKHSAKSPGVCVIPLPEAVAYCNADPGVVPSVSPLMLPGIS